MYYWDIVIISMTTLFILSKDKVYKDIEAEILPKIKDILRTKPSLRFKKKIYIQNLDCPYTTS